jgi:hypothetical protein
MMRKISTLMRLLALMAIVFAILGTAAADDRCSTQYDKCLDGYRTQTAGAWGASCSGGNPACIRNTNFPTCFPQGVVVGGTHTVTFTTSQALENFLPDGGTSQVLTQNYTNPANAAALPTGQIGNQLITLAVTLGFCDCHVSGFGDLGSLAIVKDTQTPNVFTNWTVRQVFTLANTIYGGASGSLPTGVTLTELSNVLTKINECFDNGTANTGYLFNPDCFDRSDLSDCYRSNGQDLKNYMSGVAWLGTRVTAETTARVLNVDTYDDGVTFLGQPWMPGEVEQVRVVIADGANYAAFHNACGKLYLNAWKDGNLDCDFCDVLNGAPEWFIQNAEVTPGTRTFSFVDPGVLSMGHYDGYLRFRLTSVRVVDGCNPPASDEVGETEDYIMNDLQLSVELMGGLTATAADAAVSLAWATASETNNDHFEILRDGALIATKTGAGISASRTDYSYTDNGLDNGHIYHYSLVAVDAAGVRNELATINAQPQGASNGAVAEYVLEQNYPNPFNPTTSIAYDLKDASLVKLTVFDVTGRQVALLVNGTQAAGTHTVSFDGSSLAAGVYFYRIEAGSFTATRKLMLLK